MNELAEMSYLGSADFAALTDAGRKKVQARCAAVQRILKAPRGKTGAAEKREAAILGVCHSAMRGLVKQYKDEGGDWRSMIDWRMEPHDDQRLPEAFIDFWKSLCEDNQRKNKPAHRELCRIYWSRQAFYVSPKGERFDLWPGYDERPDPSPSSADGLPRGWSYPNLSLYAPTRLHLTNARLGPIAASDFQEMVFTTRAGLRPGQHYIPDDCWVDLDVAVAPHLSQFPVRPVELGCGDIASGKKIAWGLTPMISDDEGKRNYIKKRDMRFLLARILCIVGFHKDGVTFWVEHGSAGIWPELEELIMRLGAAIGVEIRVKRSGIKGGKAFGGGYETLGKGNFRFKASYESNHNLCHNERANLPGQTGSNSRLAVVEEATGRKREATEILTASLQFAEKFRPGAVNGLRTGYLPFSDYIWAHDLVEKRIGDYTDHELQGWEAAGFMVSEFRMAQDAPWQPMSNLLRMTDVQRAAMDALFRAVPYLTRARRMSRNEAWLSGQADLVRLPLHCVPEILGPEFAKARPVEDGMFSFEDQDCGEDMLVYRATVTTPSGRPKPLDDGMYRTWVNPFDQRLLFVSTLEGNYLGTCQLKDRLERDDEEAYQREVVVVREEHAARLAPALARQRRRNRNITEMRKHNIAILDGGPVTEAEKQLAAERRQRGEATPEEIAALVATPAPVPSARTDEPAGEDDGSDLQKFL